MRDLNFWEAIGVFTLVFCFVVIPLGFVWIIGTAVRCYFGKNKEEMKYVKSP